MALLLALCAAVSLDGQLRGTLSSVAVDARGRAELQAPEDGVEDGPGADGDVDTDADDADAAAAAAEGRAEDEDLEGQADQAAAAASGATAAAGLARGFADGAAAAADAAEEAANKARAEAGLPPLPAPPPAPPAPAAAAKAVPPPAPPAEGEGEEEGWERTPEPQEEPVVPDDASMIEGRLALTVSQDGLALLRDHADAARSAVQQAIAEGLGVVPELVHVLRLEDGAGQRLRPEDAALVEAQATLRARFALRCAENCEWELAQAAQNLAAWRADPSPLPGLLTRKLQEMDSLEMVSVESVAVDPAECEGPACPEFVAGTGGSAAICVVSPVIDPTCDSCSPDSLPPCPAGECAMRTDACCGFACAPDGGAMIGGPNETPICRASAPLEEECRFQCKQSDLARCAAGQCAMRKEHSCCEFECADASLEPPAPVAPTIPFCMAEPINIAGCPHADTDCAFPACGEGECVERTGEGCCDFACTAGVAMAQPAAAWCGGSEDPLEGCEGRQCPPPACGNQECATRTLGDDNAEWTSGDCCAYQCRHIGGPLHPAAFCADSPNIHCTEHCQPPQCNEGECSFQVGTPGEHCCMHECRPIVVAAETIFCDDSPAEPGHCATYNCLAPSCAGSPAAPGSVHQCAMRRDVGECCEYDCLDPPPPSPTEVCANSPTETAECADAECPAYRCEDGECAAVSNETEACCDYTCLSLAALAAEELYCAQSPGVFSGCEATQCAAPDCATGACAVRLDTGCCDYACESDYDADPFCDKSWQSLESMQSCDVEQCDLPSCAIGQCLDHQGGGCCDFACGLPPSGPARPVPCDSDSDCAEGHRCEAEVPASPAAQQSELEVAARSGSCVPLVCAGDHECGGYKCNVLDTNTYEEIVATTTDAPPAEITTDGGAPEDLPACFASQQAYTPEDLCTQKTTAEDAEACQQRCQGTPFCAYFSFWAHDNGCHLQDANAVAQALDGVISGPATCPHDGSTCFTSDQAYALDGSVDMCQGRTTEPSAAACQTRCQDTPGCAFFSFWGDDGGCHLEDANATATSEGHYGRADAVSGPATCPSFDEADDADAGAGGAASSFLEVRARAKFLCHTSCLEDFHCADGFHCEETVPRHPGEGTLQAPVSLGEAAFLETAGATRRCVPDEVPILVDDAPPAPSQPSQQAQQTTGDGDDGTEAAQLAPPGTSVDGDGDGGDGDGDGAQ